MQATSSQARPFDSLNGWWIGTGRLGFKNGKTEEVKCRATYKLLDKAGLELRQSVRCASASGKIEVLSDIRQVGGKLVGSWSEKTYEMQGKLTGKFLPNGFRVNVDGGGLRAEMTIGVRKSRHIVEVRFYDSTLIGLSMLFRR